MFEHFFYLKQDYLPIGASGGRSELGNRITGANFLVLVLQSNYRSILLIVAMASGRTTTDGRRTDVGPTHIWPLSWVSNNVLCLA